MVNLWPFGKSDDASVAAFEKTISTLQTKITKATNKRDFLRKASRRLQALWLLYTSFAYILFVLITFLVTGKENLGRFEYTALAGGPVLIYIVRTILTTLYNYRISSANSYLQDLEKQREAAIDKFKTATKYNSTQAVLERYGAAPPTPRDASRPGSASGKPSSPATSSDVSRRPSKQAGQPQRTGFAPPATANIQRPNPPAQLAPPNTLPQSTSTQPTPTSAFEPSESFAPNAFDAPPPRSPQYAKSTDSFGAPVAHHAWYERLMDALIGEDESKPINRLALICGKCRLVNGVAPPGVKTIEEIGRWRCAECKEWNGSRDEVQKILEQVRDQDVPGVTEKNLAEDSKEVERHDT